MRREAIKADRNRLLTLLLSSGSTEEEVGEILDRLCNTGLPFDEKKLGGGPWNVSRKS